METTANSPVQTPPSLQQWLKENPRSSINDYYRAFGEQKKESQLFVANAPVQAPAPLQAPSATGFFITPAKAIFLGIFALLILMASTNPDEAKHKESVKQELLNGLNMEKTAGDATKDFGYEALGAFAGRAIAAQFADLTVNSMVSADSYIFFSLTNITFNGVTKTIGVGVLGNVFVTSKVQEKIKEHMSK